MLFNFKCIDCGAPLMRIELATLLKLHPEMGELYDQFSLDRPAFLCPSADHDFARVVPPS